MKKTRLLISAILALLLCTQISIAQEEQDNTGTNPGNFTYDARFYSEMAELYDPGGSYMISTFEFRLPLGRDISNLSDDPESSPYFELGQKWQLRLKSRYKSLNIDNPEDDPFNASSVSGIGDMDLRILYMAYTSKNKKISIAAGLEATFNLATNDALGTGKNLLSPMIFFVFPGSLGKGSLFVPAYQYVFDIGGDPARANVSRSQIDLYFVWLLAHGKNWLIVDPQILIDHNTGKVPILVEIEWGTMIKPVPGASVYLRPGMGVGEDRPYTWNFEAGLKFIWR